MTIDPPSVTLLRNETVSIVATGSPPELGSPAYSWFGVDPSVATFQFPAGSDSQTSPSTVELTGVEPGETTISVVYQTESGETAAASAQVETVACRIESAGLIGPAADVVDLPEVNDLSEQPIMDQVAHRTIRFRIEPIDETEGQEVQWTFTPDGAVRGTLPAAHSDELEAADDFFSFDSATNRSVVNAVGEVAVRVNMPPIAFNKGRLRVELVDDASCSTEVDFEVPGVVVIDPGHGGSAPGTESASGVLEKVLALDMGERVRAALGAQDRNMRVLMTRTADTDVAFFDRANVARDNGADIFLSIHFNTLDFVTRGTETFVRTSGDDQVNHTEDLGLAGRINNATLTVMPGPDRGLRDNDWAVLRDSELGNTATFHTTRACLHEVDFIDVPAVDEILITGGPGGVFEAIATRQSIANAIAAAILDDMLNQP